MTATRASFGAHARVLVTGASGFIGGALVQRLLQEEVEVHAIHRHTAPSASGDAVWHACDLEDELAVQRLIERVQPEALFHLASRVSGARDREAVLPTLRANLLSAVNVLTAATAHGCRRIVLTGSMEEPAPTSAWPVPSSPYAAAKLAASAYGRMFHLLYAAPVVTLRLFMVYGPGQRDRKKLIPYTILSLLNGEAPRLMSGGRMVDWVYVDDVVEGYVRAATMAGVDGKTIDIASGTRAAVRDVVERLGRLIDPAIRPQFGVVPDRAGEQEPVADLAPAASLLDWTPRTPLDTGLARTVEWYRAHVRSAAVAVNER